MLKTICDTCDGSGLVDVKSDYLNEDIGTHTVGDLKKILKDMDDDAIVTYQRIEDVYFEKHKWKADLLVPEGNPLYDYPDNEYITAFCSFKYEKDGKQYLCITAHY